MKRAREDSESQTEFHAQNELKSNVKLLTLNIWFDSVEVVRRMEAIGEIISTENPDFVGLQEVTPEMFSILIRSEWAKRFTWSPPPPGAAYFCILLCSYRQCKLKRVPFKNSVMGRDLVHTTVKVNESQSLTVATSHLESMAQHGKTRREQLILSFGTLAEAGEDCILMGDMNLKDTECSKDISKSQFKDGWSSLHDSGGFTFDSSKNSNIKWGKTFRARYDRIFCKLSNFELKTIRMIGTKSFPLPNGKSIHPSDHFGLVCELQLRAKKGQKESRQTTLKFNSINSRDGKPD